MRSCFNMCDGSNWNATLGGSLTLPDRICLIHSADVKTLPDKTLGDDLRNYSYFWFLCSNQNSGCTG